MIDTSNMFLVCLLSTLPVPPGVIFDDAYFQLYPIDKTKCPIIDPIRDISFNLFTRNNPIQADLLIIGNDTTLKTSNFDFSKPTVIFFHAFFESSTSTTAIAIRSAYMQRKEHFNVILLDAPRMEAGPWYLTAARNTRVVGEYTASFIDYLVSRGLQLASLHLIGLSLGAQMAGVCGRNVKSGRVPRITGLDPAGPLFTKWPLSLKLDRSDAVFVDVIHTDAGIFGYPKAIGHADFWPNAGISPQPGCKLGQVKQRNPDAVTELLFCSHWRSYQFYAESVVTEYGFWSMQCRDWAEFASGKCVNDRPVSMGFYLTPEAKGNYFLMTRDASPYSLQTPLKEQQLKIVPKQELYNIQPSNIPVQVEDLHNNVIHNLPQSQDNNYISQQQQHQQHNEYEHHSGHLPPPQETYVPLQPHDPHLPQHRENYIPQPHNYMHDIGLPQYVQENMDPHHQNWRQESPERYNLLEPRQHASDSSQSYLTSQRMRNEYEKRGNSMKRTVTVQKRTRMAVPQQKRSEAEEKTDEQPQQGRARTEVRTRKPQSQVRTERPTQRPQVKNEKQQPPPQQQRQFKDQIEVTTYRNSRGFSKTVKKQ